MGAPLSGLGAGEVQLAAATFEYYAGGIDKYAGECYPAEDGFLKFVRHEPLGVCAGIIPWNSPLASVALKAAPALATGNCFILKPSEKTPFAALALGKLIKEAGFPPGVFQVLSGDGSTGALLSSHMKVKKISFTGSLATGKRIQMAASQSNMKRETLELGGKSPAVIFYDCNLDNAATWCANALATNTGQICFAATRVYVQGVQPKFIEVYKAALEATKTGDPSEESTTMGPLVDAAQFDRVSGFIERAKKDNAGGILLIGGKRVGDKGFYLEPTVFIDSSFTSEIYTEEIFGPVAVVNTLRFAAKLDTGVVGINCVSTVSVCCSFGGTKDPGVDHEHGHFALRSFTEPKTVLVNMIYE